MKALVAIIGSVIFANLFRNRFNRLIFSDMERLHGCMRKDSSAVLSQNVYLPVFSPNVDAIHHLQEKPCL